MRSRSRAVLFGVVSIGLIQTIGSSIASAQGSGPRGSLGGYGASMRSAGGEMGSGGSIIPYAGRFGGFMPSRMGGGGELSFQPRSSATMGPVRTSFSLPSMSSGMSSSLSRGMGGSLSPMGSMGTVRGRGGRPTGMGVMPPSIGYPFRQPPSLLPSGGGGMGMSM